MRKTFEQSKETEILIAFFLEMKTGQRISYQEISEAVGFLVTTANAASARSKAEKDHGVFIACERGVGFVRGSGDDMVDSGYGMFTSVRQKMRKCSRRMLNAISENLDEKRHRMATDMYSRANIIADTSRIRKAESNAKKSDPGRESQPFDYKSALTTATRKPAPK